MSTGVEAMEAELDRLDRQRKGFDRGLPAPFQGAIEVVTPMENDILDNVKATNALIEAQEKLRGRMVTTEGNLYEGSNALGISTDAVAELSEKYGIDLSGSVAKVVPSLRAAYAEFQAGEEPTNALVSQADEAAEAFEELDLTMSARRAGIDLRSSADELADLVDNSEELAEAQEKRADAAEGVSRAEHGLAVAQRASREAQEALTKARKDDAEQMEDLRFAAEGSTLAEPRAAQRLADARREEERTRAFSPSSRRRQDALLDLREAELADRMARDRREDAQGALAEADALGPEGRPAIVNARRAVDDTLRGETDAQRQLDDARRVAAEAAGEVETAIQRQDELALGIMEVVDAARNEVEALVASGDVANTSEAKFAALRDRLSEVADRFPALRGEIDPYIGLLNSIPDSRSTVLSTNADEARKPLKSLVGALDNIPPGKSIELTMDTAKAQEALDRFFGENADRLVAELGADARTVIGRGGAPGPVAVGFDSGGWLMPGLTLAYNGTGAPERVVAPVPPGTMPVSGSDPALAGAVRSLQQQVARLGTTKVTKFEIGEVRAQDYADFMRQLESRQRMANLAGGSWPT